MADLNLFYLFFQVWPKDRHVDSSSSHESQQRCCWGVSSGGPSLCCRRLWWSGVSKHSGSLRPPNQWVDTGKHTQFVFVHLHDFRPFVSHVQVTAPFSGTVWFCLVPHDAFCSLCKCQAFIILTEAQLFSASQHLLLPCYSNRLFFPGLHFSLCFWATFPSPTCWEFILFRL